LKSTDIKKALILFLLFCCLAAFAGCDYQRMRDQESVRTYKKEMPAMDERTVPVHDGFQELKTADPNKLMNPVPSTQESIERGRLAYGYYCAQCHGVRFDGMGTVGQSFYPLPSDLRGADVQSMSDGDLYAKIRLGYLRHPRLFTTISEGDAWAVVNFLRTIKG